MVYVGGGGGAWPPIDSCNFLKFETGFNNKKCRIFWSIDNKITFQSTWDVGFE